MHGQENGADREVVALPSRRDALVRRPPTLPAGSLVVRSLAGGVSVSPREDREVLVGRDVEESHVGLGVDDRTVSRRHLSIRFHEGRWWLENRGRRSVRLPTGTLLPGSEPVPVPTGYTAAFVEGTRGRTHLVELLVADGGPPPPARYDDETVRPTVWPLSPQEREVMLVLGQRYLRHDPDPQPLTWQAAADELHELDPDGAWTRKRVERMVTRIRGRLAHRGVPGLRAEEIEGPVGHRLNHHLIRELVDSTTIVAVDLAELEARLDPWA